MYTDIDFEYHTHISTTFNLKPRSHHMNFLLQRSLNGKERESNFDNALHRTQNVVENRKHRLT